MHISIRYKKFRAKSIVLWLILFGFVFGVPKISFINGRRVAILIMIAIIITHMNQFKIPLKAVKRQRFFFYISCLFFCFLICVINAISYNDYIVKASGVWKPSYFVNQVLYIPCFAIFCVLEFEDLYTFAKYYISMLMFQSFIILLGTVNKDIRVFIYKYFYYGDNTNFQITSENGTRLMGLGVVGSEGSLILFTGIALLIYMRLKKLIPDRKFALYSIIILCATVFVGRTGLYLEIAAIAVYFVLEKRTKSKYFLFFKIIALSIIILAIALIVIERDRMNYYLQWSMEIFNRETRFHTINIIRDMDIPPLTSEFIFGTNIHAGYTPCGVFIRNDSGYVKTYAAFGIVGAVLYYVSHLCLLTSVRLSKENKSARLFLYFLIVLVFIVEWKEPYIMKYNYSWFLMTVFFFVGNGFLGKKTLAYDNESAEITKKV